MRDHPSAQVSLHKSSGGVFEITVDGNLAFSKRATGHFPTEQELSSILR